MKTILLAMAISIPLSAQASSDPSDYGFTCTGSSRFEDGSLVTDDPNSDGSRLWGSFAGEENENGLRPLQVVYDIRQVGSNLKLIAHSGKGPSLENIVAVPVRNQPFHFQFTFKTVTHSLTCVAK